jgi:hypothetical protein
MGGGDARASCYRVGGGAGQPGDGGERAAAVVRYNGGGGSCFRRGSAGAVVGSDEGGGSSGHFGSGRGEHREAARVHACEAVVAASTVRPGEEDDQAGLACRRERVGRAGWAG